MPSLMSGSLTAERKLNDILTQGKGISTQEGAQEFVDTVAAILDSDSSDKDLDIESKSKALVNLRKACGRYGIVPTSYVLTGIVKLDPLPQKTSITIETWRGTYETKAVAIKKLKITERDEDYDKIKARFCKEAVLWKRLTHKNVLPFMGVSRDIGEFCFISPWMNNGSIMEYIRDNHQIYPLELLKDAANGLDFLHSKRLVHGDLRAQHILVGGDGQACIANTGHSGIISTTFAVSKSLITSGTVALDQLRWRWAAPELQRPDGYGMQRVIATKASDVYGMGMVIYEVLTREAPFSGYTDIVVLEEIQNGKRPRRPANTTSSGITDPIWMLLGQCWDPQAAIPRQLKLKMKDIVTDWETKRSINPYVTLQYGPLVHTTSRAAAAGGNKYVWDEHEDWLISHEKQYGDQMVTVQLFHRGSLSFKRRELLGTGELSLSTTTMDLSAKIDGQLTNGLSGAKIDVQLMVM